MKEGTIPAWVLQAIEEWLADGGTDLHLIGRHGVVKHIRREEMIWPPVEERTGQRLCPACRKAMQERDYGNLWVCECGLKRTKAQMAQSEG